MTEEYNNTEEQFFKKLVSDDFEAEKLEVAEEDGIIPVRKMDLIKTAMAGVEIALGVLITRGLVTEEEVQQAMASAKMQIDEKIEE